MYTHWFSTVDEVEQVLGVSIEGRERPLIEHYLETGERPFSPGCWHCVEGVARANTGWIDYWEDQFTRGEAEWPWKNKSTGTPLPLSGSIPVVQPA